MWIQTMIDGDQWCAKEYGLNIQEGVCAFGDTEEEAVRALAKEMGVDRSVLEVIQ